MLQRALRKTFNYVCQRIVNLNKDMNANGFMEINPKYYDDILVQNSLVEHWVNKLDTQIARAKIKEQFHKEGIARCNYLAQEVLPIIGTAMSLLKQSMDTNAQLLQNSHVSKSNLSSTNALVKKSDLNIVDNDQLVRYQNLNLMINDTFQRLGEKRNEINKWLSSMKMNTELLPES